MINFRGIGCIYVMPRGLNLAQRVEVGFRSGYIKPFFVLIIDSAGFYGTISLY